MSDKPAIGKELILPKPAHLPNIPVYVLLYTDLKTYRKFNELSGYIEKNTKPNEGTDEKVENAEPSIQEEVKYRNSECDELLDEFVLHGLRLYDEKEDMKRRERKTLGPHNPKKFDFTKLHADLLKEYKKISPGLSKNFTTHMDHMNHQYKYHGWRINLSPEDYFNNIVYLHKRFDLDKKIRGLKIDGEKIRHDEDIKGDEIAWRSFKARDLLDKLKPPLGGKPRIKYFKHEPKKMAVYEFELYLDEQFEIMDAPLNHQIKVTLKDKGAADKSWEYTLEEFEKEYKDCLEE